MPQVFCRLRLRPQLLAERNERNQSRLDEMLAAGPK